MSSRPNRVALARRKPGAAEPTPAVTPADPAPAAPPPPPEPPAPEVSTEQRSVAPPTKTPTPSPKTSAPSHPAARRAPRKAAAGEAYGGRSVQYAARLDGELVTEWRDRVQATGRPQSAAVAAAVEAFIALGEDEADRRILDVVQVTAATPAKGPALPYSVRLPEDLLARWKALVDELARPQAAAFTAALRAFLEHDPSAFDREIRDSIRARKDAA